jgi:hypothetical protein
MEEVNKASEEQVSQAPKIQDKPQKKLDFKNIKYIKFILPVLLITFVLLLTVGGLYVRNSQKIAEITPTPTIAPTTVPTMTASPTATIAPTAIVSKVSIISKAPTSTPTPAGSPTLVVRAGKGVNSVTLLNQSTGKTITESISSPGKNYYVDPGAYRVTFNEVQNCRAAYSLCYQNCSLTSGHWGSDAWGTTANINVESGKTHAVSLYYADPAKPVEICKTL